MLLPWSLISVSYSVKIEKKTTKNSIEEIFYLKKTLTYGIDICSFDFWVFDLEQVVQLIDELF